MRSLLNFKRYDFRVGIIGCGNLAYHQIKYIARHVKAENITLSDMDRFRMECLAGRYGVKAVYRNVDEMLCEFRPQIVHILTPPTTHFRIAMNCLEHGTHVFVEKPMCMTAKESEAVYALARKQEQLVCVDHLIPFDPLLTKVKNGNLAKDLGKFTKIFVRDARNYFARKKSGCVSRWLNDLPGELLFDIIPHHLSIVDAFLGDGEIQEVNYDQIEEGISEIRISLGSTTGLGEIHLDINSLGAAFDIVIVYENGWISVDLLKRSIKVVKDKFPSPDLCYRYSLKSSGCKKKSELIKENLIRLTARDGYIGMQRLIEQFYKAIETRIDSPISMEKGLKIMRQVEEIFCRTDKLNRLKHDVAEKEKICPREASQRRMDTRILVTGATGFIGRVLVNRLKKMGHRVRVLARCRNDYAHERADFWNNVDACIGDVSDSAFVEKACQDVDLIFHLAAATGGSWTSFIDSTVRGTENVVKAALKSGCQKLVYVSSIALLNQSKYPPQGLIDETYPYEQYPARRDVYCFSKLWAEKIVNAYAKISNKLKIVIVRPGIVYGPGRIPLNNLSWRWGNVLWVKGSGKRPLPLVYVANLIDALLLAGWTESDGVFNVVDREEVTVQKFFKCHRKLSSQNYKLVFLPIGMLLGFQALVKIFRKTMGKPDNYAIYKLRCIKTGVRHSTRKLESELGWSQKLSFEEGMILAVKHCCD